MENGLRSFITLLGVVVAAVLGGCSDSDDNGKAGVYIHNGKKISVKPHNRQR